MNESQNDGFPHLYAFIDKHVSGNTEVLSPDVLDELKVLLENYEGFSPTSDHDYKTLLEKLSSREEENKVLRLELEQLETENKNYAETAKVMRQTILKETNVQEELHNDQYDRINELTDSLQRASLELDNLKRDFGRSKDLCREKERTLEELEKTHSELLLRYEREAGFKSTAETQTRQDLEVAYNDLNKKKEELSKLSKELNKLSSKNKKLTQNNEMYKQTFKANDNIVKNLEKKVKENEQKFQEILSLTERKLISYRNIIDELKKELNKTKPGIIYVNKVISANPDVLRPDEQITLEAQPKEMTFANVQLVETKPIVPEKIESKLTEVETKLPETIEVKTKLPEINIPQKIDEKMQEPQTQEINHALGNLSQYAEFFTSERYMNFPKEYIPMNQNSFLPDGPELPSIPEASFNKIYQAPAPDFEIVSNENNFFNNKKPNFNDSGLEDIPKVPEDDHLSEDDDPTIVFPKVISKASKNKIEENFDAKLDQILNRPKEPSLTISQPAAFTQSKFNTNPIDIKQELENRITNKRITLSANRNALKDTLKFGYEEHTPPKDIHEKNEKPIREMDQFEVFKPAQDLRFSQIKEDTFIDLDTFISCIEFLENYLAGSKNPTTLTLTDFEKNRLIEKYAAAATQNFRKFYVITMKFFLEHINFIEGQINNLIHAKSYLDIKVENMKSEFKFLLKSFMDKNQKSQDFLNEVNENFGRLKANNKGRLKHYRDSISQRNLPKLEHNTKNDKQGRYVPEPNEDTQIKLRTIKKPENISASNKNNTVDKASGKLIESKTSSRALEKNYDKINSKIDLISVSEVQEKLKDKDKDKKKKSKNRSSSKSKSDKDKKDENVVSKFLSFISFK